jgi:hypothetical protein
VGKLQETVIERIFKYCKIVSSAIANGWVKGEYRRSAITQANHPFAQRIARGIGSIAHRSESRIGKVYLSKSALNRTIHRPTNKARTVCLDGCTSGFPRRWSELRVQYIGNG